MTLTEKLIEIRRSERLRRPGWQMESVHTDDGQHIVIVWTDRVNRLIKSYPPPPPELAMNPRPTPMRSQSNFA